MRRREMLASGVAATVAATLRGGASTGEISRTADPSRDPASFRRVHDAIMRPWADRMKAHLDSVMIENEGGSGGARGTAAVIRAQPDGCNILMPGPAINVINCGAVSRPPCGPKGLAPVRGTARGHCRTTGVTPRNKCFALQPHPEERAIGARLEGWMHGTGLPPSFETHRSAMLLRMRPEKRFANFWASPEVFGVLRQ